MMNNLLPKKNKNELEELKQKLRDRNWRLNNLYWIKDKHGKRVKFRPNQFQQHLLDNLHYFNLVLKARQLGITTFFCIIYLDAVLFSSNKTAGIIAHKIEDAKKIFKDKIKFPFDNLPDWLKDGFEVQVDSRSELTFKNGSSIFVSLSTRSGTVQYLHISELGYTSQKYPDKAEEIVTGAINSVEQGGYISIESTAKGQSGYFYELCQEAQLSQKEGVKLNPLQFRFFFFSWWENFEYTLQAAEPIPSELQDYFQRLRTDHGIVLTEPQRQWYYAKQKHLKENMRSEYPSTPEEAFISSIEGAYYASQLSKVYEENRITTIPYDPRIKVDTWWDLGMNDFNVILLTQTVGKEIRFIDLYYNRGEGLDHYVKVLQNKSYEHGYQYGDHYFPHDIEVKELGTGITRREKLHSLRLWTTVVVPKLSVEDGIEGVRSLFGRFWFDKSKTDRLIKALANYRKEWDEKLGTFKSKPLHDEHSHFADALRTLALGWREQIDYEEEPERKFDRFGLFNEI